MGMELGSEFVSPERAAPPVVIAPGHRDPDTSLSKSAERLEGPVGTARDDRPVLEPEFEQVSIDDEVIAKFGNDLEESVERVRLIPTAVADVGVRDDYCCRRKHGAV
jgi:hypothetical protein